MGMNKDELDEIKSKYLEQEIYIKFNNNLKVLEKNLKIPSQYILILIYLNLHIHIRMKIMHYMKEYL